VKLFSADPLAVTIDSSGTTFDMAPIDLSKTEYTSSLAVAQSLTIADVVNIARLSGGKIQVSVSADDYAKMAKGGSLTISGLKEAYPQGTTSTSGAKTDLTSLNGTFDITNKFQIGTGGAYIIELDGSAGGTTALGTAITWTSTPKTGTATSLTTTYVEGDTLSSGSTVSTGFKGSNSDIVSAMAAKTGLDITSVPRAQAALTRIRNSIDKLAQDRASLGAVQSRLNFTNEQLTVTKENLSAAISRIADVDVAEEATAYARYQILVQSGTSMLAQANKMPQSALQLLQG
jgi:flagellin